MLSRAREGFLNLKKYESFQVSFKHTLDWLKHIEVEWIGFHTKAVNASYWEACDQCELKGVKCSARLPCPFRRLLVLWWWALVQWSRGECKCCIIKTPCPKHTQSLSFSHSHFSLLQVTLTTPELLRPPPADTQVCIRWKSSLWGWAFFLDLKNKCYSIIMWKKDRMSTGFYGDRTVWMLTQPTESPPVLKSRMLTG